MDYIPFQFCVSFIRKKSQFYCCNGYVLNSCKFFWLKLDLRKSVVLFRKLYKGLGVVLGFFPPWFNKFPTLKNRKWKKDPNWFKSPNISPYCCCPREMKPDYQPHHNPPPPNYSTCMVCPWNSFSVSMSLVQPTRTHTHTLNLNLKCSNKNVKNNQMLIIFFLVAFNFQII